MTAPTTAAAELVDLVDLADAVLSGLMKLGIELPEDIRHLALRVVIGCEQVLDMLNDASEVG